MAKGKQDLSDKTEKELTLKVDLEMISSKNDMEKMFNWAYKEID